MRKNYFRNTVTVLAAMMMCVIVTSFAAPAGTDGPKDAQPATKKANEALVKELNFEDQEDFADAQRGFIAGLPGGVIKDSKGMIVWDLKSFDFINQKKESPDTVNPSLWRQARLNMYSGLFKVVDRVYQIRGLDVSNMTIIEGDRGLILIDPLVTMEPAAAGLELYFQHRGKRPVVAVIYTHSHLDHWGGVKGVVSEADVKAGKVKILAPDGFMEAAVSENVTAGAAMSRRSFYWYGTLLPKNEKGLVDVGLGKSLSLGGLSLIPPTDIIMKTGDKRTIDGVQMIFSMVHGTEAPAEMMIFFPQFKVLDSAELACHTMHNILTLRGAQVRDAEKWSDYMNEAMDSYGVNTEVLIAQHHWPRWGRDRCIEFLKDQRDLYKYVHDQTLRLMNLGYTMNEIGPMLSLPSTLARKWYVRGYYGTMNHDAKAVYQKYLGWYDMNPANLNPLAPVDSAKKYVQYMGGASAIIAKAREDFKKGEFRWVAQVMNQVVFADPANKEARSLQADALEQLGYQAEAGTWRSNYLTAAYELRTGVHAYNSTLAPDVLKAMTIPMFFNFMGISLNGPRAEGKTMVINWNFTDVGEKYVMNLENCALTQRSGVQSPRADVTVTLTRAVFDAITLKQTTFEKEITAGKIKIVGNASKLAELMGMMDTFNSDFNIVTP